MRSGGSTKQAQKNLLQQLPVSFWTNTAHMFLRYWALQCEDNDFAFHILYCYSLVVI